jgi:hypothetical protein
MDWCGGDVRDLGLEVLSSNIGRSMDYPDRFLVYLIVGFCILLRVYPLMLFLKTTVRNNAFCARFYCALLTTCFGPDRWPSSRNMYIKCTKVTTVYVNRSVEMSA